jgi:4'-phosphopantetheinyl transferase EntD
VFIVSENRNIGQKTVATAKQGKMQPLNSLYWTENTHGNQKQSHFLSFTGKPEAEQLVGSRRTEHVTGRWRAEQYYQNLMQGNFTNS